MDKLIDVTHTVKASEVPSEGARFVLNPKTGERFWTNDGHPAPEVPPRGTMVKMPVQPNPEVPPVPMPTKGRKNRGS